MYEVKERDWKVLRKKVPDWQEDYMAKLNQEYIALLQRDENPSTNFWDLEKRVFKDKKKIGVVIDMRRSKMVDNLIEFLVDKVITMDDLDGFSDELIEEIKLILDIYKIKL